MMENADFFSLTALLKNLRGIRKDNSVFWLGQLHFCVPNIDYIPCLATSNSIRHFRDFLRIWSISWSWPSMIKKIPKPKLSIKMHSSSKNKDHTNFRYRNGLCFSNSYLMLLELMKSSSIFTFENCSKMHFICFWIFS